MEGSRESDDQMTVLLDLFAIGELEPDPVMGLGELPSQASRACHVLRDEFELRFGLRLADGTDEPLMLSTSEVVATGIVSTQSGASKLLHRLEAWGVVWSPGAMPALGRPDGTRLFLPGRRPIAPMPDGGWLVRPDYGDDRQSTGSRSPVPSGSDDAPGAALEPGPVPVEAEVVPEVAVEPAVEAPDEPGVGDAVGRASSDALDGVAAVGGDADGASRSVGHGAGAYAAPVTGRKGPTLAQALLDWAMRRVQIGSRNAVGYELARQAHDNGFSYGQMMTLLNEYGDRVPKGDHRYTARERMATVRSVVKLPRREPWSGTWAEESR